MNDVKTGELVLISTGYRGWYGYLTLARALKDISINAIESECRVESSHDLVQHLIELGYIEKVQMKEWHMQDRPSFEGYIVDENKGLRF